MKRDSDIYEMVRILRDEYRSGRNCFNCEWEYRDTDEPSDCDFCGPDHEHWIPKRCLAVTEEEEAV